MGNRDSVAPSAPISASELTTLKKLCESKGIYWKLADYHYDARLSPSVVLKLIAEIERLSARALDHHVIDLRYDGWTIQHPLDCRPNLFDCEVNAVATKTLKSSPKIGRYRVDLNRGRLKIGKAEE